MCWPLLCLCLLFMIFEGCLDSNLRELALTSRSATNLATHAFTQPPIPFLAAHPCLSFTSTQPLIHLFVIHPSLSHQSLSWPPIPLLIRPSLFQPPIPLLATHPSLSHPSLSQPPIPLLIHPSLYLSANPSLSHPSLSQPSSTSQPPIPLLATNPRTSTMYMQSIQKKSGSKFGLLYTGIAMEENFLFLPTRKCGHWPGICRVICRKLCRRVSLPF